MLHIQCAQCGAMLKGKEVIITPFSNYINGAKYADYAVTCSKCGGAVVHERYAQMAAKNKAKAMAKIARKTGKTIKKINEEQQYNAIMRKAGKRAKEIAKAHSNPTKLKHLNQAIEELPQEEKGLVLAYEDKLNMELLDAGTNKPTKHIKSNAILLLTQSVIECAIADKDEDFFKSEYGAYIVDTYNTVLSMHKHHDYGITAELLLEKMRKGAIRVKGDDNDE